MLTAGQADDYNGMVRPFSSMFFPMTASFWRAEGMMRRGKKKHNRIRTEKREEPPRPLPILSGDNWDTDQQPNPYHVTER